MLNVTKISYKSFAQKCSSGDWSNGPTRLQYMPLIGQNFHLYIRGHLGMEQLHIQT